MANKVIMFKSDFTDTYRMQKEYDSKIPIEIMMQLALIEKHDWPLFRESPYSMFGEFIYHNLSNYPKLKGYINKHNYKFEFNYELITDYSNPIHTSCFHHDTAITEDTFSLNMYRKNYLERWVMIDSISNKTLIFFDYKCEFNSAVQNTLSL